MTTPERQQRPRPRLGVAIIAASLVVAVVLVTIAAVVLAGDDSDGDETARPRDNPTPAEPVPTGPPPEVEIREVLGVVPRAECDLPRVWCDADRTEAYLLGPAELRTDDIVNAESRLSPYGEYVVGITLSSQGAERFETLTRRLTEDSTGPDPQLAVVVSGTVISAPTVQGAIPGGEIDISSKFTQDEAEDLAAAIDP
jgi:hypothetical protein